MSAPVYSLQIVPKSQITVVNIHLQSGVSKFLIIFTRRLVFKPIAGYSQSPQDVMIMSYLCLSVCENAKFRNDCAITTPLIQENLNDRLFVSVEFVVGNMIDISLRNVENLFTFAINVSGSKIFIKPKIRIDIYPERGQSFMGD